MTNFRLKMALYIITVCRLAKVNGGGATKARVGHARVLWPFPPPRGGPQQKGRDGRRKASARTSTATVRRVRRKLMFAYNIILTGWTRRYDKTSRRVRRRLARVRSAARRDDRKRDDVFCVLLLHGGGGPVGKLSTPLLEV